VNAPQTLTPGSGQLELDEVSQDLLFRAARSVNSYADEPVSDEQVQAIYDLVKYAPTALNSQPMRIFLVRSDQAREHLLKHMSEGNREKTATAPLVAMLAADTDFHEHLPRVFPHAPDLKDNFGDRTDRERMARFNSALQVAYFVLGVRAAGLAAGPMGGFDAAGLDDDFFPDGRLKSLLVVGIGKPGEDAWRPRLPRLDYDEVVTSL
jgi:3-hydroxypropanoate dehydrogenase